MIIKGKDSDGNELEITQDQYLNTENIFILESLKNPKRKAQIVNCAVSK